MYRSYRIQLLVMSTSDRVENPGEISPVVVTHTVTPPAPDSEPCVHTRPVRDPASASNASRVDGLDAQPVVSTTSHVRISRRRDGDTVR